MWSGFARWRYLPSPSSSTKVRRNHQEQNVEFVQKLPGKQGTAPHSVRAPRVSEYLGLLGLCSFSLFAWLSGTPARMGLAMVVLACILDPRFGSCIRRSLIAWIAALTASYIVIRTGFAMANQADLAAVHLEDEGRLLLLCCFIFVGWCLAGHQKRILVVLGLVLVGFILGRIEHMDLRFDNGIAWSVTPPAFGLPSANAFAEYVAVAVLGLAIMGPRLWRAVKGSHWAWLAVPLWLVLVVAAVEAIFATESRAVWASLVLVAPFIIALYRRQIFSLNWRAKTVLLLLLVVPVLVLGYVNRDVISNNLSQEVDTYTHLLAGDINKSESNYEGGGERGVGARVHMLLFGFKHWQENPLFGFGPGATKPLIDTSPRWTIDKHMDLHNSYMEILLRLGVVGAGLFLLCLVTACIAGWQAYRQSKMDRDIFVFLISALSLHAIVSFANFRMLGKDGCFFWLLIGGALITLSLCAPQNKPRCDTN